MEDTNKKKNQNNNLAIVGFVLSVLGISVLGLIFSLVGLLTSKDYKNGRKGFAIAGLIISSIVTIIFLLIIMRPRINEYAYTESGSINLINKYKYDIDFSGVSEGANCLSGNQHKEVFSVKYGFVKIDFSYCKLNNDIFLHIYN